MRDIIRCDQCGKESSREYAAGWARVLPCRVRVTGDPLSAERDFCSVACLVTFYQQYVPARKQGET